MQSESLEKHSNFGKVPAYIERYKEEQKQAQQLKMIEQAKAKMPAGTRLMDEDDRVRTLDELVQEKKQLTELLIAMPLSMKTQALLNKKRELEQKLEQIEKAISTFSRKVVYIKDENAVN